MYRHGPATGGSRQVSLRHCAGGTHLSPNSIRPSGQKHPGEQAHPVFHRYMYLQKGIGTNIHMEIHISVQAIDHLPLQPYRHLSSAQCTVHNDTYVSIATMCISRLSQRVHSKISCFNSHHPLYYIQV